MPDYIQRGLRTTVRKLFHALGYVIHTQVHPTGIEPVTTPWKGAILPLNYGCVCVVHLHTKSVDCFEWIQTH